jgi:KDO2-lipid IV(A) lauroyltransferase
MIHGLLQLASLRIKNLDRDRALKKGEAIASLLRLVKYRKDVVFKNLDIAFPEKSYLWKEEVYKSVISNIGRNIIEFLRMPYYYQSKEIKRIFSIEVGKDLLDKYREQGAVLVTAHLGNWEIAGSGLTAYSYPITALAYRQKNEKINAVIESIRKESGMEIIYHDQNLKTFLKALNQGRYIAFLVDQNALRHRGVFVDFFGLKASTVTFPAKLAVKYNKPILFSYCIYSENEKKYKAYIEEIQYKKSGNFEEDIKRLTQSYTKYIEEAVKRYPGQYLWTHKRWKTRPEGEKEFY